MAQGVVYARVWNDLSLAYRWSMATGYVSVGLIGTALLLGPWWVIRGQRAPISSDSRRDVGLWGAAFALLHVATALQVHMHGDMLQYFMYRARDGHAFSLRLDRFGFANWIGLRSMRALAVLVELAVRAGVERAMAWVLAAVSPIQGPAQRQQALAALGVSDVAAFQRAHPGVESTGEWGPLTHAALLDELQRLGPRSPLPLASRETELMSAMRRRAAAESWEPRFAALEALPSAEYAL